MPFFALSLCCSSPFFFFFFHNSSSALLGACTLFYLTLEVSILNLFALPRVWHNPQQRRHSLSYWDIKLFYDGRVCVTQTTGGKQSQADISSVQPLGSNVHHVSTELKQCTMQRGWLCLLSVVSSARSSALFWELQRKECKIYPLVTLTAVMSPTSQIRVGIAINTLLSWEMIVCPPRVKKLQISNVHTSCSEY